MKTARAITRISLVEPVCGPFYLLDLKLLRDLEKNFLQDGIERFGKETLKRAVSKVAPEFSEDVRRSGAAKWCPAQRKFYKQPGFPEFIGGPLSD